MEEKEIIFEEKVQKFGVVFVCDLKRECSNTNDCVKNGGPCAHTFDPRHASNFSFLEIEDGDTVWFVENCDVINNEEICDDFSE